MSDKETIRALKKQIRSLEQDKSDLRDEVEELRVQIEDLEEFDDDIDEDWDEEPVGFCEQCEADLYEGDGYHYDTEDGVYICESCAVVDEDEENEWASSSKDELLEEMQLCQSRLVGLNMEMAGVRAKIDTETENLVALSAALAKLLP